MRTTSSGSGPGRPARKRSNPDGAKRPPLIGLDDLGAPLCTRGEFAPPQDGGGDEQKRKKRQAEWVRRAPSEVPVDDVRDRVDDRRDRTDLESEQECVARTDGKHEARADPDLERTDVVEQVAVVRGERRELIVEGLRAEERPQTEERDQRADGYGEDPDEPRQVELHDQAPGGGGCGRVVGISPRRGDGCPI